MKSRVEFTDDRTQRRRKGIERRCIVTFPGNGKKAEVDRRTSWPGSGKIARGNPDQWQRKHARWVKEQRRRA